jgi:glyoxylase-like metal-dependent hydrolase (beta-lactamase superfamily II)
MTVIVDDKNIRIEKLLLGPWGTNCYIVVCPGTSDSLVIDAPASPEKIIRDLEDTQPKYILLTHGHGDHIGALPELRTALKVPLAAHPADATRIIAPDVLLNDGDTITLGNLVFDVLHTPGHTPGGLCFLTGIHLFSGDSIFPGGPGRTGSPEALKQLITSLKEKVFTLPDNTNIYPGHGEITTLKKEKEAFAFFELRQHSPGLCGDVLWRES